MEKLVWQPIENYNNNKRDWVLVQFVLKSDKRYMLIPRVCELRKDNKWHILDDNENGETFEFINESCKAVAFIDIPKYKGAK